MALRGPFVTQTASSVSTCQSGVPLSVSKIAIGVMLDSGRFTPGVLTPRRGGSLGRFFSDAFFSVSCAWVRTASDKHVAMRNLICNSRLLFREGNHYTLGVDAPDRSGFDIREPDRAGGYGNGASTVARELLHDVFRSDVDPRERKTSLGDPDKALSEGNATVGVGHPQFNRF